MNAMCFTCGYELSIEGRTADSIREAHAVADGAHEGSFYVDDTPLWEFAFMVDDSDDTHAVILPGVEPGEPAATMRCADLMSRFNPGRMYRPTDVEIIGTYRV